MRAVRSGVLPTPRQKSAQALRTEMRAGSWRAANSRQCPGTTETNDQIASKANKPPASSPSDVNQRVHEICPILGRDGALAEIALIARLMERSFPGPSADS